MEKVNDDISIIFTKPITIKKFNSDILPVIQPLLQRRDVHLIFRDDVSSIILMKYLNSRNFRNCTIYTSNDDSKPTYNNIGKYKVVRVQPPSVIDIIFKSADVVITF